MAPSDVPPDIGRALAADPAANRIFARLAPSHVREYLNWINQAKRETTRRRRIGGMIERLREAPARRGNGEG